MNHWIKSRTHTWIGCCTSTAAPTFKSDGDRPYDKKANIGEDVVFRCNAYAIPEASIVWYKNAEPMDRMSLMLRPV